MVVARRGRATRAHGSTSTVEEEKAQNKVVFAHRVAGGTPGLHFVPKVLPSLSQALKRDGSRIFKSIQTLRHTRVHIMLLRVSKLPC